MESRLNQPTAEKKLNPYLQTVGTRVAYKGDCANQPGVGSITAVDVSRFGVQYEVTLAAEPSQFGEEFSTPERRFWIAENSFASDGRFILSPEEMA